MGCAPSNGRPPSRDSPQASRISNKRHSTNNITTPTTTPRHDPSDESTVRSKKPPKKRREALTNKPRSGSHSPQTTHSSLRSPEQKYQPQHQGPSSFYYQEGNDDDEDDDDEDERYSQGLNTNRSVVSLGGSRRAVPKSQLEQGHFAPLRDSGDSGDSLANQANPFSLEDSEGSPMMPSTQQFSADVDQPLFSRTPSAHHDALNQQAPVSFVISKQPSGQRSGGGPPQQQHSLGVDATGNFGFRQELEQRQKTRAEKDEEELERRSVDRIRAKQRRRFGKNGGYLTPKLGSLDHYRGLMRTAAQDSGSDADDPYFNTVDGAEVVAEGRSVEVLDRDRNVLFSGNADLNSSQSSASGTPRSILRKQSSFGEHGGPGGGGGNLVNSMRHRQGGRRSRGNSMQQRLVRAPSMCSSTVSSADSGEGYAMGDPFMGSMTSSRNIPSMQFQQPQSSSEQSSASPAGLKSNNNPSPLTLGAPEGGSSNQQRQHHGYHNNNPTGGGAATSPASPGTTTPTTRNPSALLQLPVGPGGNTTSGNGTPNSSFGALSPGGISAHINTPNDHDDQSEGSLRMKSDLCDLPAFIADDLHLGGRTSSQMTLPVNNNTGGQQQQQANPSPASQAALSPTDTTSQQSRSPQPSVGSRVTFRAN